MIIDGVYHHPDCQCLDCRYAVVMREINDLMASGRKLHIITTRPKAFDTPAPQIPQQDPTP